MQNVKTERTGKHFETFHLPQSTKKSTDLRIFTGVKYAKCGTPIYSYLFVWTNHEFEQELEDFGP